MPLKLVELNLIEKKKNEAKIEMKFSCLFSAVALLVVLAAALDQANAHGRLMDPPARSSAWREDSRFPANYDDNQMWCGGAGVQWQTNGGKCGICGEAYNAVKQYEKGGVHYRGHVVRTYQKGQNIDVVVDITANHKGWFEFRLCNIDGRSGDADQDCFDANVLESSSGAARFSIAGHELGKHSYAVKLPDNVTCNNCVLQWKYNTGNSWGTDSATGQSCVGCGPQEQFYGCADVKIQ